MGRTELLGFIKSCPMQPGLRTTDLVVLDTWCGLLSRDLCPCTGCLSSTVLLFIPLPLVFSISENTENNYKNGCSWRGWLDLILAFRDSFLETVTVPGPQRTAFCKYFSQLYTDNAPNKSFGIKAALFSSDLNKKNAGDKAVGVLGSLEDRVQL